MAIVIINPNSTEAMTVSMVDAARRLNPGLEIEGRTSFGGPPAIQGQADGDAAIPPLLEVIGEIGPSGADAIVIGCFDDTGLEEAARRVSCPVVGIGQAAFHLAALRQWRFSVVTTLSVSVPVIEGNIRRYGLDRQVARVRASEVPVLALEEDDPTVAGRILAEAEAAQGSDGIDAIVLGCAGMVRVTAHVRRNLGCRVIDPVEAGVSCAAWLMSVSRS